jgi:hypothetical protein
MVAALLLVELGCAPQDAINRVRAARPGSLDLPLQEDYIRAQTPTPRSADIYQLDLLEAGGAAAQLDSLHTGVTLPAAPPVAARYALQR